MAKRPAFDLSSLTAAAAQPMQEAVQRAATVPPAPSGASKAKALPKDPPWMEPMPTEELVPLSFKVPPGFRHRFRLAAARANVKNNQLLAAMLDQWEQNNGKK